MLTKALILGVLLGGAAFAADPIFLPNLGKPVTGTTVGASRALDVYVADGTLSFTESATAANGGSLPALLKIIGGYDGANVRAIKTDSSGSVQVDVESSALPTGAATAANQSTANASLASIDGKLPASLGQKTSANSLACVLASDQSAVPSSQSGTWNVNNISGTVSLPTGASTAANQATEIASLAQIDTDLDVALSTRASESTLSTLNGKFGTLGQKTMAGSAPVVIASDQSAIPASQSGTWNITNVSGTVSLPTGAATAANQSTANTSLSNIDTNTGRTPRNANATDSVNATATGAAESEAAPADAVGFILSADAANTDSIRWRAGGTAAATSGHELEPGRDTGVIPVAANLSIFAVSGSQLYQLTWIRR